MLRRRAAGLALVVTLVTVGGVGTLLARRAQARIDLEVVFDGGYIYHLGGTRRLEVKTLEKGLHPMRVRIESGTQNIGISEFRLNDATLELLPDGSAPTPAMPQLPPEDKSMYGCDQAKDQAKPNNRIFLPNLDEAAQGMGTTLRRNPRPERAGSIILTGGGELAIREVAGCVEYRTPNGTAYGNRRSMASGIEGVVYRWSIPGASTLTLRITPDMGNPLSIVVTPENRKVRLHVGSFDWAEMDGNEHKLAHFASFDDAFQSIDPNKRISLWWVRGYQKSPGIDCPSGGDPQP